MTSYPAMCLHLGHKYQFLHPMDIVHIQSEGNYSHLKLKDGSKITLSKKLKDIESSLPDDLFERVHHSSIINLFYIDKYVNDDSNEIVLIDGSIIRLSRRKKAQFLNRFIRI